MFLLLTGLAVIVFDLLLDKLTGSSERGFGAVQIFILLFGILLCLAAFYKQQHIQTITRMYKKTTSLIQHYAPKVFSTARRYWLFELIALFFIAYAYLYNPVTRDYPLGYAGLFQLEIDLIQGSGFSLPRSIPWYGPGGIPAAYPFLGLYLGAVVQHFLHVSSIDYLRFAPAVLSLAATITLYFFVRLITKNRGKAIIAAALTTLTYEVYAVHATAAGIVRAGALLFMLLALIFIWKVITDESNSKWVLMLAGLFTALTVMTHISYVVFLFLTAGLLWISHLDNQWKSRTWKLVAIGAIGVVLSSPWWGTVIYRYGFSTLMNASNSHGTLGMISRLLSGDFNYIVDNLFSSWGEIPLIGFSLLAAVYSLLKRKYFHFFWFIGTFFFVSDRRFLILVGAVLSAELIHNLFTEEQTAQHTQWRLVCGSLLLLGFVWVRFFHSIRTMPPTLTEKLVSAAEWIKENSDPSDQFLFFIKDHDTAEWGPYLTQRVPSIGHWGSEWLGNYPYRYDQWKQLSACAQTNTLECLGKLTLENDLSYKYLIYAQPVEGERDPFTNSEYSRVYVNEEYTVYMRDSASQ